MRPRLMTDTSLLDEIERHTPEAIKPLLKELRRRLFHARLNNVVELVLANDGENNDASSSKKEETR